MQQETACSMHCSAVQHALPISCCDTVCRTPKELRLLCSTHLPHLLSQAYSARVLIINQDALRAEPGVIWVVAFRAHVAAVTHQEQWQHVEHRVAGGMQPIAERHPRLLHLLAGAAGNPDVSSLLVSSTQRWCQYRSIQGLHDAMQPRMHGILSRQHAVPNTKSLKGRATCRPLSRHWDAQ